MVRRFFGLLVALCMSMVALSSPAQADDSAGPVAVNDSVQMYAGAYKTIDQALLANDSHPESTNIWVCAIRPVDEGVYFGYADIYTYSVDGTMTSTVHLSTYFDVTVESVQLTYALCDGEHTSWAIVDLDIVYPERPVVTKTKRPGRIKFVNPNDDFLTCGYGSFDEVQPDGWVEIAANSRQVVSVNRRRIDWLCYIGYDWGYVGEGRVRNITLAKSGDAKFAPRWSANQELNHRWRKRVS